MSEMVDRVAAVLLPAFMGHGFDNPMSLARSHAHAAIEAMREPTNDMINAAYYQNQIIPDRSWSIMIEQALK